MAYSDYGGYAYRNGVRIEERSDATITPEGDTFGTPGIWPGFGMMMDGVSHEEVQKRIEWPHGHAVIGDGPIYGVLYKQGYFQIFRGQEVLDMIKIGKDIPEDALQINEWSDSTEPSIDTEYFIEKNVPCKFEVDGYLFEVYWTYEDNYYPEYVRMTQPDGTIWTAFSGYGVGAGLEECGYGYSTEDRIRVLSAYF